MDNRVARTPYGHLRHALRYKIFFVYWVRRSLATRYRQTSLGWLWGVLQPLISSLIYIFVFSVVLQVPTGAVPYPLFVITDLVFWSYFSRVVLIGATSITGNLALLSHIQFPREFLPLAVWVESLVDLALGLLIVAAAFIVYRYPLSGYGFTAVLAFAIETMLAVGLAFGLAALSVIVRDVMQITPLLMQLVLYISPVIYPLATVPERVRALYLLNPLGPIFAAYQSSLFYDQPVDGGLLAITALIAAGVLIGGYVIFKRVEWQFADML